jgi:hypothetical protein
VKESSAVMILLTVGKKNICKLNFVNLSNKQMVNEYHLSPATRKNCCGKENFLQYKGFAASKVHYYTTCDGKKTSILIEKKTVLFQTDTRFKLGKKKKMSGRRTIILFPC